MIRQTIGPTTGPTEADPVTYLGPLSAVVVDLDEGPADALAQVEEWGALITLPEQWSICWECGDAEKIWPRLDGLAVLVGIDAWEALTQLPLLDGWCCHHEQSRHANCYCNECKDRMEADRASAAELGDD